MPLPRFARPIWRFIRDFPDATMGWGARLASQFEPGSMVISSETGAGSTDLGPRVAVFCHFEGKGRIRAHTRAYIDALRGEGLDIVFVTNAGHLTPGDLAWIQGRAARVVIRRNVGYDFGAWRDAIAACQLPAPGTALLLIANDSVYGPFRPLGPLLRRVDFREADVWGVTDSWQHRFHLQSYFVAFGPAALASPAFNNFWRSIRNVRSKWWIVTRYEIGLTRGLMAAGLRCRALWPYTELIETVQASAADRQDGNPDAAAQTRRQSTDRILDAVARDLPLNATADLWQVLIEQGMPFLKRELVGSNPSGVPDAATWPFVVGALSEADRDLIIRDLEGR